MVNTMRKAFTFIELVILVTIIAVIAAIVILNLMEQKALKESADAVLGRTFILNGMKAMVTSYSMGKYKVVLMGSPATLVEMDKPVVDTIYAEYLKTHAEKQ
jgi:competence protein ComGC